MKIRITRGRVPRHAAASAKIKRGEAEICVPEDSISPDTANVLSATLTYVSNKVRRWDIRNPKIAAGVGVALVTVFTVGFILAPATIKNVIWNVLPGSGSVQAGPGQPSVDPSDLPKLVSGDQPMHSHHSKAPAKRKPANKNASAKPAVSSSVPAPEKTSSAPTVAPDPSSTPVSHPDPSKAPPEAGDPGPVVIPPPVVRKKQPPPVHSVPNNRAHVASLQPPQGILGILDLLAHGII